MGCSTWQAHTHTRNGKVKFVCAADAKNTEIRMYSYADAQYNEQLQGDKVSKKITMVRIEKKII